MLENRSSRAAWRAVAWLLPIALAIGMLAAPGGAESVPRGAIVLHLDGAIGPASADYVARGIVKAVERDAAVVVLRMDTPGGLDASMRDVIRAILASPIPVLTYVGPSGARAASAGTYILYASHVAAMAPGTNLGAATPVAIGGGLPFPGREEERSPERDRDATPEPEATSEGDRGSEAPDTGAAEREAAGDEDARGVRRSGSASEAKAINDAVAYIRALAQLRSRNADWAESAVRDAASLSAEDAAARGVIDFVASGVDDLLAQADGRVVSLGERSVTLETRGLPQTTLAPDWRTRLLGAITNPNVALILMMIGFYGLLFEFMNPGALYPGTIGAISLLVGLYALAALPVNFAGLALVVLGLALMIAEAFTPSMGVLGIGGAVAFVLGGTILIDTEAPGFDVSWPLLGGVAAVSLGLSLLVVRLAWRSRHRPVVSGHEGLIGAHGRVLEWAGRAGRVLAAGERWKAESEVSMTAGQRVRVVGLDGLTLRVEPDPNHET